MANATATLQALNMLLSSQERRQQADIQASLGGMELALKERQAEDLSRHRRATEYIQAGQLAESERMGIKNRQFKDEQIKSSGIIREANQQKIFAENLKIIKDGLGDATTELANNIWYSMGLDAMYDAFAPVAGKDIEDTHHKQLYNYLVGDKVKFKKEDAKFMEQMVLGYGSMQQKNPLMMMKMANYFSTRMKNPKQFAHFLTAASNAGMIVNFQDPSSTQSFNNSVNMLDKARKIQEYRAYLRKEESELTYQAKKGETKDYEREVRYEFQSPDILQNIQSTANSIDSDSSQRFNPTSNIYQTTYGAGDEQKAADSVKKIQGAQEAGDYEYNQEYANLMGGYVAYNPTGHDDAGNVTGWDFSSPIIQMQQDVSGKSGAFEIGFSQDDLKGSESELYDRLEAQRDVLVKEIADSRQRISDLQTEGVNVSSMSTLTALAEDSSRTAGRDVDLWREQERVRLLNEQQMRLNQQIMKTTTGQWDEWTRMFGGWSDAGSATSLRRTLPGSMLTETERDKRYRKYQTEQGGRGTAVDVARKDFTRANPGASLEDYLGQPISSVIPPSEVVPQENREPGKIESYLSSQWDANVKGKSFLDIMYQGGSNILGGMGEGLYTTGQILGNATKPYKP